MLYRNISGLIAAIFVLAACGSGSRKIPVTPYEPGDSYGSGAGYDLNRKPQYNPQDYYNQIYMFCLDNARQKAASLEDGIREQATGRWLYECIYAHNQDPRFAPATPPPPAAGQIEDY